MAEDFELVSSQSETRDWLGKPKPVEKGARGDVQEGSNADWRSPQKPGPRVLVAPLETPRSQESCSRTVPSAEPI